MTLLSRATAIAISILVVIANLGSVPLVPSPGFTASLLVAAGMMLVATVSSLLLVPGRTQLQSRRVVPS